MSIISVSGKIGSGKDTVASIIKEAIPSQNWEVRKFAGKLKQIASILSGTPIELFEDQEFKKTFMANEWGMTYREFLQRLGTEAIRNGLHENAWIISTFADYTEDCNWIITDTRFLNEIEAVESRGALKILVIRGNGTSGSHPSENSLESYTGWDYILYNDSTIEDLRLKVLEILAKEKLV